MPLAVTTTLAGVPVSFIPSLELTNDFDAQESYIACVIASSIELALTAQCSRLAFHFLRRYMCCQWEWLMHLVVVQEVEERVQRQPGKGNPCSV
jgi:hypothetical protein